MATGMRQELHRTQSELEIHSVALTENKGEVSELSHSMEKLKDQIAMAQREKSTQPVATQGAVTFKDKIEMTTHELRDVRQELVTIRAAMATLMTREGAIGSDSIDWRPSRTIFTKSRKAV